MVVRKSDLFYSWAKREQDRIDQMSLKGFSGKIKLALVAYPPDLRSHDFDNILGGIQDLLVSQLKLIVEDNYFDLELGSARIGCIDPQKPRVEVTLTEVEDSHRWAIAILRDKQKLKAIAQANKVTQRRVHDELMAVMKQSSVECSEDDFDKYIIRKMKRQET